MSFSSRYKPGSKLLVFSDCTKKSTSKIISACVLIIISMLYLNVYELKWDGLEDFELAAFNIKAEIVNMCPVECPEKCVEW